MMLVQVHDLRSGSLLLRSRLCTLIRPRLRRFSEVHRGS
jgi:hypothetical protein